MCHELLEALNLNPRPLNPKSSNVVLSDGTSSMLFHLQVQDAGLFSVRCVGVLCAVSMDEVVARC